MTDCKCRREDKTWRRIARWLVLVLTVCGGVSGVMAEEIPLYLYLMSDQRIYPQAKGVNFRGYLHVGHSKTIQHDQVVTIRRSTLVITDQKGQELFVQERVFGIPLQGKPVHQLSLGSGMYGVALNVLKTFKPGTYQAVWKVDGNASETVAFKIKRNPIADDLPSLWIEPVAPRRGLPQEPLIIVQYANQSGKPQGLSLAVNGSRLLIDGKPMKRIARPWNFPVPLLPGDVFGKFIQVGEYEIGAVPGVHRVAVEFAGQRSNSVSLELMPEDVEQ